MDDLGHHAPLDIGLIDEVNDEIQELEKKLNVYVSQVLSDKRGHGVQLRLLALQP